MNFVWRFRLELKNTLPPSHQWFKFVMGGYTPVDEEKYKHEIAEFLNGESPTLLIPDLTESN